MPGRSVRPVPDPPDFTQHPPRLTTRPQGEPIFRVFDHNYPPNGFHPGIGGGVKGRFHFFADRAGAGVPVLYGSSSEDGAFSETVFRDVPVRGPVRVVRARRLENLSLVSLIPQRDLQLVELLGYGLKRLQLLPEQLTSTPATAYPWTVPWAQALKAAFPDVDGLVWMARQFNAARALILFGDRVDTRDLTVASSPLPLAIGPGRARLEAAANAAGIAIV